ncbi:tRNA (adenosine(37)-N6)-threonylcarbamoyltransferase complex dimerization subunit type 1 TsaB [Neorhizobium sp. T786]|uniref:tRNA (adenosine(37)-N6)-threonylcarbamoyltransferase complex dimerization subunit type 1 TsaB n=1 Tax=Pseudorhizobium xiangyangii TaxID=2883104 RepID=UPI001CFF62CA|nr:tRNA (adenosine(37)-N6)-threonylcarbamoyltransferase complex dimerization subunit type 1 TsaB [Neorhizobium xiangyangii]MCB5201466.1 tRNA (adenosine(37)-N6)-threonylcarbamoyltransferase complex dimerization subunit type 1 TsaB [Neorhizobium xiangyangii]
MIVLAIDTAGVDCSAALYDSETGRMLAAVTDMIGKGHAERLMAVIDEVLAQAALELKDVDRIAVVIGPGSFTGIRVGVAAARGLALALDISSVGITTLETLAAMHLGEPSGRPLLVAMDAKRNELYVQTFAADGRHLSEPVAMSPEDTASLASSLSADVAGSGRALVMGEENAAVADRFDIATVARLGALKTEEASRPKPLYLRGPDAKPQTGYALARS